MNAVQNNRYTAAWRQVGQTISRSKAILSISAHWFVPETGVTITTAPRTIHDFGGFPRELYQVQYPAPGDPALARRVRDMLAPLPVRFDESWGLDHATWSVLCHVYPRRTFPWCNSALMRRNPHRSTLTIGQKLGAIREEGVLIVGSGNVVHNLHACAWGQHMPEPYDWAARFEKEARGMLLARDHKLLIDYERLGGDALLFDSHARPLPASPLRDRDETGTGSVQLSRRRR